MFGTTELDEARSAAIKKTYALLSLGVVAAIAGGFIGARTPALVQFFATIPGWIVAMIALNAIPYVVEAAPGIATSLDLPITAPRGALETPTR